MDCRAQHPDSIGTELASAIGQPGLHVSVAPLSEELQPAGMSLDDGLLLDCDP